jgi:hypothetical protein
MQHRQKLLGNWVEERAVAEVLEERKGETLSRRGHKVKQTSSYSFLF